MSRPQDEQFNKKETQRRFEAALRGAFATPPKPMKSMTPKRPKPQGKKGRASAPKSA